MILCLVTDRRRLGTAMAAGAGEWKALLGVQVAAAVQAGVDLVQVREPDLEARELKALVQQLMNEVRGTETKVVVNDRFDVALAARAHGVHLKERSFLPATVRRHAPPGLTIGCSIHGIGAIPSRTACDYFIAGTVLPTPSKPGAPTLGWEGLADIVRSAGSTPVLGIGGLNEASMTPLAASGAAGLAAVGAFIPVAGEDLGHFVQKRVQTLRFLFDTACEPS